MWLPEVTVMSGRSDTEEKKRCKYRKETTEEGSEHRSHDA